MKYDKIVEISRSKSREKIRIVEKEIQRMLGKGERITVTALVRRTGLSESYFYKNAEVKKKVDSAARKQIAGYNSMEFVAKEAMYEEILELKLSIKVLKLEVERLNRKNEVLMEENELLRMGGKYEIR